MIPVAIPLCTSCVKSLFSTGQAGQPAVSVAVPIIRTKISS